jgi:molecular chaperone DnaK
MNKMINFGIDLGTTNSAIAKFISGEVEIFQNPQQSHLLFTIVMIK